jgi:hypothetical protein
MVWSRNSSKARPGNSPSARQWAKRAAKICVMTGPATKVFEGEIEL